MSRRYSLVLIVLLVAFLLASTSTLVSSQEPLEWVSPTSYSDPDSTWFDEPLAYDGNITSAAYCDPHGKNTWSTFLELEVEPLFCDSIRYYSHLGSMSLSAYAKIDIDLYYSNSWHDLYEGQYQTGTDPGWVVLNLGRVRRISAMRVRYYNTGATLPASEEAFEFDFGRSHPTNVRNILGTLPTVAVAVLILVFGMIMVSTSLGSFLPSILMGAILIVVFVGLLSPLTSIIGLVP